MAKPAGFRPGSTRISVKNEGRIVVLYDERNREALAAACALDAVISAQGGDAAHPAATVIGNLNGEAIAALCQSTFAHD